MTEDDPPFQPFGFSIPIRSTGRRIWASKDHRPRLTSDAFTSDAG